MTQGHKPVFYTDISYADFFKKQRSYISGTTNQLDATITVYS